jgi:hypothetical protein
VATGVNKVELALKAAKPAGQTTPKVQFAPEKVEPAAVEGSTAAATTTAAVQASTTIVSDAPRPKPFYFPKTSEKSSDDTGGSGQSSVIPLGTPDKAVADWTVPNPKGLLSPHVAYARQVNWGNTPLGPLDKWSPEFRQIVNLCMVGWRQLKIC